MKELRDQSAHFITAIITLLPFAMWPNLLTGAFAGFMVGLVREITEEGTPVTPLKVANALHSRLDLTFWTLGGIAVGALT